MFDRWIMNERAEWSGVKKEEDPEQSLEECLDGEGMEPIEMH